MRSAKSRGTPGLPCLASNRHTVLGVLQEMLAAIPQLAGLLGSSAEDAHRAAVAITTTDLVSKSGALEVGAGGARRQDATGRALAAGQVGWSCEGG